MTFRKFVVSDGRRLLSKRYLSVILIYFLIFVYLFFSGWSKYKDVLSEKELFQELEKVDMKDYVSFVQYSIDGHKLFLLPSSFEIYYNGGPVPPFLLSQIDTSERTLIYQPAKGPNAFDRRSSGSYNIAGLILYFGSLLALIHGFSGLRDREWIEFMVGMVGNRNRVYVYLILSRLIFLFLFFCLMALVSIFLTMITGLPTDIGAIILFFLVSFILGAFFQAIGFLSATCKTNLARAIMLLFSWFVFVFVIPFFITEWTGSNATSVTSVFSVEQNKKKILHDFETEAEKKAGRFEEADRATEEEKNIIIRFWGHDYVLMEMQDQKLFDQMNSVVSFSQTLSAFFPTTNYLSVAGEMSGRGYNALMGFCLHTKEKKKEFVWYYISNEILTKNDIKKAEPFIKGDKNIYFSQVALPGNFGVGMMVMALWVVIIQIAAWFRFNRQPKSAGIRGFEVLSRVQKDKVNPVFDPEGHTFERTKRMLELQETRFIVIPSLSHLPDGIRVKHLLKTFGGQVSDSLREVADSYTHTLKPVERLSVMLELLKTCPEDVFLLFHNTVAGEAEEVQKRLKGFLISEKSNRTLLYFSNSHKFPDTEGQNLILDPQKR